MEAEVDFGDVTVRLAGELVTGGLRQERGGGPARAAAGWSRTTTWGRSPQAGRFPGATALDQARSAGKFTPFHDARWAAAVRAHGDAEGTGALIEVLLLAVTSRTRSERRWARRG